MSIAVSLFNSSVDNLVNNSVDRYLNLKTDSLVRLFKDMDENIKLDSLIEYQLLYKQYEKDPETVKTFVKKRIEENFTVMTKKYLYGIQIQKISLRFE